ncbi:ATP-binding protein [Streptomyces niger]|uniref:ATP-binding protein n=1 Tax=Streptomyces niger TaxID=66373 RepID=UPI0006992681|nr:ATP-binding protein [Streptomyces niger]
MITSSQEADVSQARRATAAFLAENCPWVDRDAVVLVVSELIANAEQHASGWWRLSVSVQEGSLVVELRDGSEAAPVARQGDLGGAGGHGWHIVQRLAGDVAIENRPGGKSVRARWQPAENVLCA